MLQADDHFGLLDEAFEDVGSEMHVAEGIHLSREILEDGQR